MINTWNDQSMFAQVKPVRIWGGASAQVLFLTVHSGEWHWGNWEPSEYSLAWPAIGDQS